MNDKLKTNISEAIGLYNILTRELTPKGPHSGGTPPRPDPSVAAALTLALYFKTGVEKIIENRGGAASTDARWFII